MLLLFIAAGATPGQAADETTANNATPPRVGFTEGEVSFWRPGAEDWVPARVNIPVAPGDRLYAGPRSSLELQIGGRVFLRASAETQVGLANNEADFVQFDVAAGRVALDVRDLPPGDVVEIDTPTAALTVQSPGYYRVEVGRAKSVFVTRRGGRGLVMPAHGQAAEVRSGEEVVVDESDGTRVATYGAPAMDDWDRWNDERTDDLLQAASARYLPSGVAGARDLDAAGAWRTVEPYGPVWVPRGVPVDWAPYSTGQWIWDPFFGWTWIDDTPWGWVPYHYGRWVSVGRSWAWAPGPIVAAPVYAPALVAFFDTGPVTVGVTAPALGWVALGWGEPLIPWWGPVGFVGVPWWGGWGGPYVVNRVVVHHTRVITARDVRIYENARLPYGVIADGHGRFGRGRVEWARRARMEQRDLRPIHGALPVGPAHKSLVPEGRDRRARGVRPPADLEATRMVGSRLSRDPSQPLAEAGIRAPSPERARVPRQVVSPSGRIPERERPGVARSREHDAAPDGPGRPNRFEGARPYQEPERAGGWRSGSGTAPRAVPPPAADAGVRRQPRQPSIQESERARPVPPRGREVVPPPAGGTRIDESPPPVPPPAAQRPRPQREVDRERAVRRFDEADGWRGGTLRPPRGIDRPAQPPSEGLRRGMPSGGPEVGSPPGGGRPPAVSRPPTESQGPARSFPRAEPRARMPVTGDRAR